MIVRRLNVLGFTACLFLTTQAWTQDFAYFVSKDTASKPVLSPGHLSVEPPTPTVTPMQESCGPPAAFFELDALKGIPLGRDGWLDVGGSYRARYHGETNIRPGSSGGLSGIDDSFWLHQTRLWFNGRVNDWLDFRVGFIDAATAGQEFAPRAREVNRTDLYQAHVNVLLHQDMSKLTARVGRQEIRYGSARLMMAPGWANRRRTHDGVRFIWESENWEVNPFWVKPAFRDAAHFRTFDNTNPGQQLYGIFSTYKGFETEDELDLYWLAYDLISPSSGSRYDTLGSRYVGERNQWVYEVEGGVQVGSNPDDTNHVAGFFTGGFGRKFSRLPWSPELWCYYDWASGSDTVGNGFNHYVPRAHYYLGFMDLYGRRNLEDLNLKLSMQASEKWQFLAWCHFFSLANGRDVPYNLNMKPYAGLQAGSTGSQTLGTELDLQTTYKVNSQTQLRVGYSHFWAGSYYSKTPGVPYQDDANFLYGHFLFEF